MRDIRELLTEKESELERVRKEIQSLHAVIPLLEDERPGFEPDRKPVSSAQVLEIKLLEFRPSPRVNGGAGTRSASLGQKQSLAREKL